jgi:hypothetical protein
MIFWLLLTYALVCSLIIAALGGWGVFIVFVMSSVFWVFLVRSNNYWDE